jgi:hypothetical protein
MPGKIGEVQRESENGGKREVNRQNVPPGSFYIFLALTTRPSLLFFNYFNQIFENPAGPP